MSALRTGWTHQNRNLERPLFWNNFYLVYVRNMYGLDGIKTKTLTGHYFGFRFKWQSFTADALPAQHSRCSPRRARGGTR